MTSPQELTTQPDEQSEKMTLGVFAQRISEGIAEKIVEDALLAGEKIEIPHLGVRFFKNEKGESDYEFMEGITIEQLVHLRFEGYISSERYALGLQNYVKAREQESRQQINDEAERHTNERKDWTIFRYMKEDLKKLLSKSRE